jgi:Ser/Thr protein kinase RdoA (MazF antagonist)
MSVSEYVRLARAICLKCYGADASVELMRAVNHAVFRLRLPDGDRVLKLAASRNANTLRKEHLLAGRLSEHGIPVAAIEHADFDGAMVGLPFLLMRSAGEHTLSDLLLAGEAGMERLFAEMGAVLASIHNLALPADGDIGHDGIRPRDWNERIQRIQAAADWAVAQGLVRGEHVAAFAALAMPALDGRSLCHGDFHAVQCIVQDGHISAVVDWESAWSGNPGIDLAMAHTYLECYAPLEPQAAFWQGYASRRDLPADYAEAYLPVRMAQVLNLMRIWHASGMQQPLARAVELFPAYVRKAVKTEG